MASPGSHPAIAAHALGTGGTIDHDYKRNGTTDLFAANVGTCEVLTNCRRHHSGADVLRFFKLIDLHVARDLDLHVVLDNLSAHKAPEVKKWLADPKRARVGATLPQAGLRSILATRRAPR